MDRDEVMVYGLLGGVYAILSLTKIGCPLRLLTGISCMGCGMTRAFIELLNGNFLEAMQMHPMVIPTLIFLVVLLLKKWIKVKIFKLILYLWIIGMVVTYAARLFLAQGEIVVFQPAQGILMRLLELIH